MRWLLVLALLVAACGRGETENATEPLDGQAKLACATFESLFADFDSLSEDDIRSQMIEI